MCAARKWGCESVVSCPSSVVRKKDSVGVFGNGRGTLHSDFAWCLAGAAVALEARSARGNRPRRAIAAGAARRHAAALHESFCARHLAAAGRAVWLVRATGAERLQLLQRPDGPPLLVDLGWVPTEGTAPPAATGSATVEGYARAPEHPHWFSPDNDPAAHRFYTLDPAVIGAALRQGNVAPFTLVAMGRPTDTPPIPATALPRPPNNHLQYALTWFGLAAALVGVFVVWVRESRESGKAVLF